MTTATNTTGKTDKILVRMYRAGTGDFFVLRFFQGDTVSYRMMIDCGCIKAGKATFAPLLQDLGTLTDKVIDLLVITHEHADHINGFEKCSDLFDQFTFKKVWFAWTESDTPLANEYREKYSELNRGLQAVVSKLNGLARDNYYESLFSHEVGGDFMVEGKKHFIQSLSSLNDLNPVLGAATGEPLPSMAELFKRYKVIKANTVVEFLEPGDFRVDLPGAEGIRFYVLGPPKDRSYLDETDLEGETYEKRKAKSTVDFSFLSALGGDDTFGSSSKLPFDKEYEATADDRVIQDVYANEGDWRKIDHDWLFSAGKLAMRYERSINNTSLALAIQFEESERVLLFTGDAEIGNWESWYDKLKWPVKTGGQIVQKKADYFLNNTVFYKVGHHLSQNGTAKGKGVDMMTSPDMTTMVTLDFKKICDGWLSTMPNDLLGADLIRKTKGKIYFLGDCKKIMSNIKTDRVTVRVEDETALNSLNANFDGQAYMECEVKG